MKIFIWQNLECVSRNYHTNGGALIVAESLERAYEMAEETSDFYCDISLSCDDDGTIEKPDFVYDTSDSEERVISFPNAGCC